MEFLIQASDPIIWDQTNIKVETYYGALSKIFEEYTEDAYLIWNDIPVRITYEHDLYVNLDCILVFLKKLLESQEGTHRLSWGSDTFNAIWNIEWANSNVKITSRWNSISGGYEDLLNSRNYLEFPIDLFLHEWKMLLKKIINAINQSGIFIKEKEGFESLCKIESEIKTPGYLYVVVDDEESTNWMLELKAIN
jgi:hypothetical protein